MCLILQTKNYKWFHLFFYWFKCRCYDNQVIKLSTTNDSSSRVCAINVEENTDVEDSKEDLIKNKVRNNAIFIWHDPQLFEIDSETSAIFHIILTWLDKIGPN